MNSLLSIKQNNDINIFGDEISWEKHVDEIFKSDNNIYFHPDDNSKKLARLKKYISSGKILDCGCHIGRWIDFFEGNGYNYTGIDQSSYAIQKAIENRPNGNFVHSLLWDMNFSEVFDIVFTNAVLQHNTLEEQEKIIPKMYEALKRGGILYITESTEDNETRTQRTHQGWIFVFEKYGFKFIESFLKNPIGYEDNYIFIKE